MKSHEAQPSVISNFSVRFEKFSVRFESQISNHTSPQGDVPTNILAMLPMTSSHVHLWSIGLWMLIGVLIISPTAGGGGLGRLRCNVDSEGGKYTSASPRCTCLPPRQHCVEVALGGKQVHLGFASEYLLSSSCNFNSSPPRPRPSSPRLRLGELGLGLGGLERSQWVGLGELGLDAGNLSEVRQVHIPPL